jgi:adenosylcobinamide kinase/adenosylcobinamide-phosphate guanylyltransferase
VIFSSAGNRATTRCPLDKSDWTLSTLGTQACASSPGHPQLEPMKPMPTAPHVRLILGGARSGKSAFAEAMALAHGRCVYVATAQRSDEEMHRRIDKHRARRDAQAATTASAQWRTVEEPVELAAVIHREANPAQCVLVDCLTVWVGNLMHHDHNIDTAREALLESLATASGPVVLVANEVGLGIVPDNALARRFRDHAGLLNQAIAAVAAQVIFIAAGLPMVLKDTEK